MTDLKHKTLEELQAAKRKCQAKIKHHGSIWSGQKERLDWINKYIEIKAPATADSYMDYTSMDTVKKSGQRAFILGIKREDNPISNRTNANYRTMWNRGWDKQSLITCKGVQLLNNTWSGCAQTDGDCPVCGK